MTSERREFCERLVAAANPKFKDFRVDFEKISNAASKMGRAEFFFDSDWDLRNALQRRYAEAGAFDAIAKYHATIFKRYKARKAPWPDEPAWIALQLFVEHGVAVKGVVLIRTYVDMQHKRLKRDYSLRNARGPRRELDEQTKLLLGVTNKLIAEHIPDAKRDLMRDMESVAAYVETHGADDDRDWFDGVRREIWMEKRA